MEIKPVSLDKIWKIRQEVMYPAETIDFVKLEDDSNGIHLGLYEKDELVTVISLFEHRDELQFRKFATVGSMQGKGYGSYLLQYVMDWAADKKIKTIWCNARATATGLYEKMGMKAVGDGWKKYGLDFIKMEKRIN